jgi:hypothetical protein
LVSGVSLTADLKSGQLNQERNFGFVSQIDVFILVFKSEYRIMNIECRISKYGNKEEWILIFERQLDRINRIVRIERPSAEGPLAAGEKNPVNPVNPVKKK